MANSAGEKGRLPFGRVLVTGASGFVGRYLAPSLAKSLKTGAKLFVADRHSGTRTTPHDDGSASVPLDISDAGNVRRAVETIRPDLVVHLAGQAATGLAPDQSRLTWTVNFGGSLALAGAIADYVPDCTLLYVSSAEVYGLAFNKGPVTESTPLEPTSTYSHSKASAEWMLADVLPRSSRLIVMRPSNHIGAGQTTNFVLPAFAEQIAKLEHGEGSGTVYVGNLEVERDFMNVLDVVAAYISILSVAEELPSRNTFNLASGHLIRVSFLLERLRALSSAEIQVEVDPKRWRPPDVPRAMIDATLFQGSTGWTPAHSIEDAIADVLNEHRIGSASRYSIDARPGA